jgi:proteic killer suppression protein
MEIEFEKEYLEELYTDRKTSKKKYNTFPKKVVNKYQETIDKLRAATRIEDLFVINSLNYERLKGKKKHLESVRVDGKYRIEFQSRTEGEEPEIISICSIVEFSNHYD